MSEKLQEATMLALQGKLNESNYNTYSVYTTTYEDDGTINRREHYMDFDSYEEAERARQGLADKGIDAWIEDDEDNKQLTETIEWKKDIHDKNYDFHNDENDRYRRFDYEDDVYDYGTFYLDIPGMKRKQKFSVTHTISSYKNPKFNGTYNISPINPYDDSDYHYANAKEGEKAYRIYKEGHLIETMKVSDEGSDSDIEKVAQRLLELNKDIKPSVSND